MVTSSAQSSSTVSPANSSGSSPASHAHLTAEFITPGIKNLLVTLNMTNITKLSIVNYITWSLQIKSLLRGYNLLIIRFIDESEAPPPATIKVNDSETPNPDHDLWVRQDALLYNALLGSLELSNQALITTATTTLEAWNTLMLTYGNTSRGHIKQLRQQLKHTTKGAHTIDEYMMIIKTRSDSLALLSATVGVEDLTNIILDGLPDDYCPVIDAVHARDTTIPFAELHEKLLLHEASLLAVSPVASFPVTANSAFNRPQQRNNWRPNSSCSGPARLAFSQQQSGSFSRQRRLYLGRCQACGT